MRCFERAYDRLTESMKGSHGRFRRPPPDTDTLPRVRQLAGFLQKFQLASDVAMLQRRDTRTTAQPLYKQRLEEIREAGGGTANLVREIRSEFEDNLGSIQAGALDDFFQKLEDCLTLQSLTKQELMAQVAILWMNIGSTDSLRVLTEGNEEFWAVNPNDLSRLQYLVPPDTRERLIEDQLRDSSTILEDALDIETET